MFQCVARGRQYGQDIADHRFVNRTAPEIRRNDGRYLLRLLPDRIAKLPDIGLTLERGRTRM